MPNCAYVYVFRRGFRVSQGGGAQHIVGPFRGMSRISYMGVRSYVRAIGAFKTRWGHTLYEGRRPDNASAMGAKLTTGGPGGLPRENFEICECFEVST